MRGTKNAALEDLRYEQIQAYILDPETYPLPEKVRDQFHRVTCIARLLDEYPADSQIIKMMRAKDRTSEGQLRKDIVLAKQLYKTQHEFDWDFWFAWMIRDQVELINRARERNDLKAWNAAKKVMADMIGEKPVALEDPRRMERNVFNVQVNYNGKTMNVDLGKIQGLPSKVLEQIISQSFAPAEAAEAEEVFNS